MNILTIIPIIFTVVKTVEQAFPDSQGKEKFDAALKMVEQVYGDITSIVPALTTLINGAVSILNAVGIFKKKA